MKSAAKKREKKRFAKIDELIESLNIVRNNLNGDFQFKVNELNRITQTLLQKTNKTL